MPYLTERQRQVLDFVRAEIRSRGVAPTLQEICDQFGFSAIGSAQKHVRLLEQKGYLRRVPNQRRGLVLTEDVGVDGDATELPLLGTIAAGSPIEAIPGDERVAVPPDLLGRGRHYALRVRGDSMVDDGIHDGDVVVVEHRVEARDGETVVALLGDEATLKRLYREGGSRVRLQPANPAYAPLVVHADELIVQGVVVGLIRRYG